MGEAQRRLAQIVGWKGVIEPRIYRAAFVPALLAIVVAMFSLESRPRPLPQGLAADVVFDGDQAATTLRAILGAGEDRRAGTPGNRAVAELVKRRFERRGFAVAEPDRFQDEGRELVNVVGRRAGATRSQIVVVAARDAPGVPDAAGTAASTAVLMEVARVFEGRPSRKTLVLASVDGSTLGELGTERLAAELDATELVDGVIVISGLGMGGDALRIVPWSNDASRVGLGLQRTLGESLREEQGTSAEGSSPAGQLARLAFPIGIGAQGVLLDRGYDAVRLAGDGELPGDGATTVEQVDVEGLERSGRALLRALTALDQGPRPAHGPGTYVTAVSQVMPGWVLALLSLTLIFPALVASIDAFARARRRQETVSAWLLWIAAATLPFVVGLGLAHLLALLGATPEVPGAPVAPTLYPLDLPAVAVLGGTALVVALSWWGLRRLAIRKEPLLADASAPGAAVACALVLSLVLLALCLVNPFSALILVPALHLWLLSALIDPPPPLRVRIVVVVGGLVLPILLAVYDLAILDLDPLGGAWYLFLLVTGGHVSLAGALAGCVLAGVLGSLVSILRVRRRPPVGTGPPRPSVRGPATYAGPGSLGGTKSAMPRQ